MVTNILIPPWSVQSCTPNMDKSSQSATKTNSLANWGLVMLRGENTSRRGTGDYLQAIVGIHRI